MDEVVEGSGNVYADLGYDDPEGCAAKAGVVLDIAPTLEDILAGRFHRYSLAQLEAVRAALSPSPAER